MKKKVIIQINSFNTGSTGNIMIHIAERAREKNYLSYVAYPKSRTNNRKIVNNSLKIGSIFSRNFHLKLGYVSGFNDCFSLFDTWKFLRVVDKINPDIIHLHNLHNCFVNLRMLFKYLKKKEIKVVWTLHDCWAFTGKCPHYVSVKCEKWKTECNDCPLYREYPRMRVDRAKEMYNYKKTWFSGLKNLTLVAPSNWLKDEIKKSFLSEYSVRKINNGIDLTIFKPTDGDFRQRYDLVNNTILLGVADSWSVKKGLDIFYELTTILDSKYKIVLVGLSEKQILDLPIKIIGLPRISDQVKLASIYSMADFFINPSLEETMGLVTVEALACGTPVIVSNCTAVPEPINERCGQVVYDYSATGFFQAIKNSENRFHKDDCIEQAKKYDLNLKYDEYIQIYEEILGNFELKIRDN